MIITVDSAGDLEVEAGTALREILAAAGAPAARWCGAIVLDPEHRAGRAPLVHGALLSEAPRPVPAPADRARLRVIAGPDAGASLAPGPAAAASIGRGPDAALVIDDPLLSRAHAEADHRGRVRDRGSANGTLRVRAGRRVRVGRRRRRLRDGDTLAAGRSLLTWEDPTRPERGEPAPPATPPRLALAGGGALAGAVALGAATGRWWAGALVAAVPLSTGAALWWRRARRSRGRLQDGIEALGALPLPVAAIGTAEETRAVARAIAAIEGRAWAGALAEPWDRWLPTRAEDGAFAQVPPDGSAPTEARTVIDLTRGTLSADGHERPWHPALMTAATAESLARERAASGPPAGGDVRWGELDPLGPQPGERARRLVAAIGRDSAGRTALLDLEVDGPHVLVAGTTGSGKSLLLETLVAGLAHDHGPGDLAIALIDFKGGAGLGACAVLPHTCGLLTDLDPTLARRAWLGIAHELGDRKRALRARGLTSWREWEEAGGAPPRLLVVIDEFQELAAADPSFLGQAATLAAQGRSLGMHLVLATQRPAGVVTPQVRANVGTVVALRVASAAESHDLLGDDAAARLSADAPGRAVMATPTARTTLQVALPAIDARPAARLLRASQPAPRGLVAAAARRWAGESPPPRLWLPPLGDGLAAPAGAAGWTDHPEARTRAPLTWDHGAGAAVVVGPRGSARAGCAAALAATLPGTVTLPEDPREAVRTLELASAGHAPAVLIEDGERACAALTLALRVPGDVALEDYARTVPLILACGPGWPARWATRSALRLVLPGVDGAEQTLWGVPPHLRGLAAAPGRAVAIGPTGAAECRVARGEPARTAAPLVRALDCPPGLAPGIVGVRGDAAAPFALAGPVAVVGPAGAERDAALAVLRRHGAAAYAAEAPARAAGAVTVATGADAAMLRAWGYRPAPGTVDPTPRSGRVVVLVDHTCEAAQLRPAEESPARHQDVA